MKRLSVPGEKYPLRQMVRQTEWRRPLSNSVSPNAGSKRGQCPPSKSGSSSSSSSRRDAQILPDEEGRLSGDDDQRLVRLLRFGTLPPPARKFHRYLSLLPVMAPLPASSIDERLLLKYKPLLRFIFFLIFQILMKKFQRLRKADKLLEMEAEIVEQIHERDQRLSEVGLHSLPKP